MLKIHYFCIFFKKNNKPCVNFFRVWTKNANCWEILKIFDENYIEKLNFYFIFIFNFIFGKFVTKNRAFGNNTSFLQQFFRFRGDFPPSPPGYALGWVLTNRNGAWGRHGARRWRSFQNFLKLGWKLNYLEKLHVFWKFSKAFTLAEF